MTNRYPSLSWNFDLDTQSRANLIKAISIASDLQKIAIDPRQLAENAFMAGVLNYFRGLYNRFMRQAQGGVFNIAPDFWDKEQDVLTATVLPNITNVSQWGVYEAEKQINTLSMGFDNTLVHAEAAKWAGEHAGELVTQITDSNKALIQQSVKNYIETKGATLKDLATSLKPALANNDSRAQMIAQTETTRAFSQGNNLAYQRAGIPKMVFHSPLHPRCRCNARVVNVGDIYVVVWQTDRDDIVCTRPIQTNTVLGIVNGCSALHDVVISEGQWFGRKIDEVK